jgi:hypothetical protein
VTLKDLEDRLRAVEVQLSGVMEKIATSLEHLEKLVTRHDNAIFGDGDEGDSVGIRERLAALEQTSKFKKWLAGLAIGSIITLAGTAVIRWLGF